MDLETRFAIPTMRFCFDALEEVPNGPNGPDVPVSVEKHDHSLVVTLGSGIGGIEAPCLDISRRANGWEVSIFRPDHKANALFALVDDGPTRLIGKRFSPALNIETVADVPELENAPQPA